MPYIPFSDEQKRRANSVDLVDFLQRQGEQLTRSGREWRWKRHDSVTIQGNQWFRHSRKEGGLAIDFIQEFYGLNFPEAVTLLLGGEAGVEWNQTEKSTPPPRKAFELPEANSNMRRVFAYLIKQRFIDRDILSHFAHEHLLYEDKEFHNAVFVGVDENSVARHAHKRGTYSMGEGYRGNVEGSDPKYSFHHIGESDTICVFEAPIDMLSFITLHLKDWKQHSYVTLDGVAEHAVLHQLKSNPHLKRVVLCLDHDAAGIEATGRLTDILCEHGYTDVSTLQSKFKDWNEDLKASYGLIPISAQEHPKLELLPEVCAELLATCESLRTIKDTNALLTEHSRKLAPLISNGKLAPTKEGEVLSHLRRMAAASVLSIHRQYRQMDQPVELEHIIAKLQKIYRPYRDRGGLRSRVEDIQLGVAAVNRLQYEPGMRKAEDKKNLIASYMDVAMDCARTQIYVVLETPELLQVQREAGRNFTMTM